MSLSLLKVLKYQFSFSKEKFFQPLYHYIDVYHVELLAHSLCMLVTTGFTFFRFEKIAFRFRVFLNQGFVHIRPCVNGEIYPLALNQY